MRHACAAFRFTVLPGVAISMERGPATVRLFGPMSHGCFGPFEALFVRGPNVLDTGRMCVEHARTTRA
eukprot:9108521-Alexandrium_andersonii.AAC.1